jgi:glycine cleavage system aminomethyltransferase T
MLVTAKGAVPCGHVTAAGMNMIQGGSIALGFLQAGRARLGEVLTATSPTRKQAAQVKVVKPVFYDLAGDQYRD